MLITRLPSTLDMPQCRGHACVHVCRVSFVIGYACRFLVGEVMTGRRSMYEDGLAWQGIYPAASSSFSKLSLSSRLNPCYILIRRIRETINT